MGEPLPLFIGALGGGGYRRMRRQEIAATLELMDIADRQQRQRIFEGLQVMENEALRVLNA